MSRVYTVTGLTQGVSSSQGLLGLGMLLSVSYALYRTTRISKYLLKNYGNLHRPSIDIKSLIKNPDKAQHLILDNLKCTPSPDLFKQHMTFIDRESINSSKEFCFKQPCINFTGEITVKGQKYNIYCDCSKFDPFVSTPLLINNYDLLKKIGKKQKLTMISYGLIKYDKDKQHFHYQGHCFGTSLEQIEWAWSKILYRNAVFYLLEGLVLGVGFSLLYENWKRLEKTKQQGQTI